LRRNKSIARYNPTDKMRIRVREPESGIDLQLEIKLVVVDTNRKWLVTLPKGEVITFGLAGGKWLNETGEKISKEFSMAIGRVMDLLSKHDGFGKNLDSFYIEPRPGNRKIQL